MCILYFVTIHVMIFDRIKASWKKMLKKNTEYVKKSEFEFEHQYILIFQHTLVVVMSY